MSYTPQPGSMVSKLINFFNVNGDEELTADDIAAKFSVGAASVHSCLYKAIEAGLVVRKKNDDGKYVYTHAAEAKTKSLAPWPSTPPPQRQPLVRSGRSSCQNKAPGAHQHRPVNSGVRDRRPSHHGAPIARLARPVQSNETRSKLCSAAQRGLHLLKSHD